jgi:uridylate kinase
MILGYDFVEERLYSDLLEEERLFAWAQMVKKAGFNKAEAEYMSAARRNAAKRAWDARKAGDLKEARRMVNQYQGKGHRFATRDSKAEIFGESLESRMQQNQLKKSGQLSKLYEKDPETANAFRNITGKKDLNKLNIFDHYKINNTKNSAFKKFNDKLYQGLRRPY